jgi:hypothetical protein
MQPTSLGFVGESIEHRRNNCGVSPRAFKAHASFTAMNAPLSFSETTL